MQRYELLGPIGTGGMGTVFLGRDGRGLPVAVKKQHAHLADDPAAIARFFDEARLATRIEHPNVVRVVDVTMTAGELVLVMEYVEGAALSALQRQMPVRARRPLHWTEALRVVADALRGLHAAHELRDRHGKLLGVVHRDVSPQNLLVGVDGVTRVADFGVARSADRLKSTRSDPGVAGKLLYMAPEQVHRKPVDRRTDVFAAGIVLWEGLVGLSLFRGDTEAETLARVISGAIDPPSMHANDVPLEVDEICLRALERDPNRRFATAAEFAEALERAGAAPREQIGRAVLDCAGDELESRRRLLADPPSANVEIIERVSSEALPLAPVKVASRRAAPAMLGGLLVGIVAGGLAVGFFVRSSRPDRSPGEVPAIVAAPAADAAHVDASSGAERR